MKWITVSNSIKANPIKFQIQSNFNTIHSKRLLCHLLINLVELATELSTINEASTTTGGVAQDGIARRAGNDGLGVAVDGGNVVAGYKEHGREHSAAKAAGKVPWHLTSMKKELGAWTRRFFLCLSFSAAKDGFSKSVTNYTNR